jgi:hypothetical protein
VAAEVVQAKRIAAILEMVVLSRRYRRARR